MRKMIRKNEYKILTGKKYPYLKYTVNVVDLLKFPENPFCNLDLMYMNTFHIIDRINEKIRLLLEFDELIFSSFTKEMNDEEIIKKGTSITSYYLEAEELIYWIRKLIDQFIIITFLMWNYKKERTFPKTIKIDSIRKYLDNKINFNLFSESVDFFNVLNDISNGYKHSIFNTNLTILGRDEPCISAFTGKNNLNIDTDKKNYNVSLLFEIINPLNNFLSKAKIFLSGTK